MMKVQQVISDNLESNVFVVTEKGEALIIDAGARLEEVEKAVMKNRVVGILLTHGHYDHCFYVLQYARKFNCPVITEEHGIKTMSDPKLNYSESISIKADSHFVKISRDEDINLGHFVIHAFMTPGHSPCGVSYLIGSDFFAGDTVFYRGIGRTDLAQSDEKEMLESLKKIMGIKFKTLHSGHSLDSTWEGQQRNLGAYIRFLSRKN